MGTLSYPLIEPKPLNIKPYKINKDLPDNVTHVLPAHAQDIYRKAFNNAWQEYANPAERRGEFPERKRHIRWHGQRLRKNMRRMVIDGLKNNEEYRHNV